MVILPIYMIKIINSNLDMINRTSKQYLVYLKYSNDIPIYFNDEFVICKR